MSTAAAVFACPHERRPMPALVVIAAIAAAGGALAAAGFGPAAVALLLGLGLMALGAALPTDAVRAAILAALLLTPEIASGDSWGLLVQWSHGLTLTNFLIPALALPLLAGAWLAGRSLLPHPRPGLARGYFLLLAWGALTLAIPAAAGELTPTGAATLAAHGAKIALFAGLGVMLCGGGGRWLRKLLIAGIAVNAGFGLGQAAGWLPAFSGLARVGTGVRASGLFFDANMYAVLMAWALLYLLCEPVAESPPIPPPADGSRKEKRRTARRPGLILWRWILTFAVAGALVAAGSRAGYVALAAGCGYLLLRRQPRPVVHCVLLLTVLAVLFPVRSWRRVRAAAATVSRDWSAPVVADAATLDASTQARLATMRQAWRQIEAHPLLGAGFGRALYLGLPILSARPVQPAGARFHGAQNMYLTVWAGTGLVGLVLLIGALAQPFRHRWTASELAIPAGFVGILAASLTIEVLWNTRILALLVLITSGALTTAPPAALEKEIGR